MQNKIQRFKLVMHVICFDIQQRFQGIEPGEINDFVN